MRQHSKRIGRIEVGAKPRRLEPRGGSAGRRVERASLSLPRLLAAECVKRAEQAIAAPSEPFDRQRGVHRHIDDAADLRPQPLREKAEVDVRANPAA